ncbi:hypothetical protein [Streptomyces sp. NPDC101115]|uniref:DUF6197 family protein n=1 Tax=Streptomyces sp. NPDC101115 TaxID=3366106 RepID=UPI0038271337
MTIRLDRAALFADAAAALHGVPDAAELLDPMPADNTPMLPPMPDTEQDDGSHSVPAAHVLRSAARLIAFHGWCRDAMRDPDGRLCLAAAIRDASLEGGRGHAEETDALDRLLTYVRRQFGPDVTIPFVNDRLIKTQDQAANLLINAAKERTL